MRGLLPVGTLEEAGPYFEPLAGGICRVIDLYRSLGTRAFNVAVFFDRPGPERGFSAFCSVIARINPNPDSISDSAFMERLHQHPVVMTLPEEFGSRYRALESGKIGSGIGLLGLRDQRGLADDRAVLLVGLAEDAVPAFSISRASSQRTAATRIISCAEATIGMYLLPHP